MRLKARLYYALLGLNQATGFAGGYDFVLKNVGGGVLDAPLHGYFLLSHIMFRAVGDAGPYGRFLTFCSTVL